MSKLLILLGILLIGVGILLSYQISIPFLGKLPGDIVIKGENTTFYFPITTCIVLSLVLSFVLYLISRF